MRGAPCSICTIGSTDPKRLAAIHEALVKTTLRKAAAQFGLAHVTAFRHLEHSPEVKQRRAEFVELETLAAKHAKSLPPPQRKRSAVPSGGSRLKRQRKKSDRPVRPPGKVKGRGALVSKLTREVYALQLRRAGYTYPEIADEMGLQTSAGDPNAKAAYTLVMNGLDRFNMVGAETAAEARAIECARFDAITRTLMTQALEARVVIDEQGHAVAVDTEAQHRAIHLLLATSKERSKVLGLYVPRPLMGGATGVGLGGGVGRLPPALAILDPPASDEEIEHYVITGELPARAGEQGPARDGLVEMRTEMRTGAAADQRVSPRRRPDPPTREADAAPPAAEDPERGEEPGAPAVALEAAEGGPEEPSAPAPPPSAPASSSAPAEGSEPPANSRGPLGIGEQQQGWWRRAQET